MILKKAAYNPLILLYQMLRKLSGEEMSFKETCRELSTFEDPYVRLGEENISSEVFSCLETGKKCNNIYSWFTAVAQIQIVNANRELGNINSKKLKTLLSKYIDGISAGFNFVFKI